MSGLKIGEKIKAKRRERDLTQEELANILGVSKAAVSKWENEESYPDISLLPQIAQLFHITMDELFNFYRKMLFASAKSYLTSSLFTITYYLAKNLLRRI